MATDDAEDTGDLSISLVQKMLSAVTGSVLTSLLGMQCCASFFNYLR